MFSILLMFCSLSANAQEHFTFRDIPINGSEKEFGNKLLEIGYEATAHPSAFTGKFIGEDCTIFLLSSEYTKSVYSIGISFNSENRWITLKSTYNNIKEMYSEKYGKPSMSREYFDSPYYDGDGYELSAVKQNKCNYISFWEMENGSISLAIHTDCSIALLYSDKANKELDKKTKENIIKNEI